MKKRGGKRPGAGRKPGSTKPELLVAVAGMFVTSIHKIGEQAEWEGRPCNPVTEAYMVAYAADHPDKVIISDGMTVDDINDAIIIDDDRETVHVRDVIKILDEAGFQRYCEVQKKLRRRGLREFMASVEEEEAPKPPKRRRLRL